MSLETTARKFVELCSQGKNFDVMNTMYADDIVSIEANGQQWSGKKDVIQKSADWEAAHEVNGEKAEGPFPSGADQFAVHFTFDVTVKDTGEHQTLDEIALYTVEDDQITREQLFYEGNR
jgi:hypothetical protein